MAFDTSAQVTIVKLFADMALPALRNTLKMGSLINQAYSNSPGNVGDTVNVPVPPTNVVANDITEGSDVATQQTTIGNVQVVVNKHKESTFTVTDVAAVLSNLDLYKTWLEPHIIAVAEQIETDIYSQYTNLTTTAVGTAATPLTSAVIGSAESALFNAKAYGEKYLSLGTAAYDIVRALPEFVNQYQIGNDQNALATGILGQIKGFNVFRSQLQPAVTAGSPAVTTAYGIAFVPDAITLCSRQFKAIPQGLGAVSSDIDMGGFKMQLVWSYNPNALAQQFTVHALYGTKALRPTFGLQVRS